MTVLASQLDTLQRLQPMRVTGSVATVRGMSVLVSDLPLPIGSLVRIEAKKGSRNHGVRRTGDAENSSARDATMPRGGDVSQYGEVVGFDGEHAVVMLFGSSHGLAPGCRVIGEQSAQTVHVGRSLLGRIINGLGQPIDGGPLSSDAAPRPLDPMPTGAMQRQRISEPLPTGITAIDALTTLGKGQRMGIFSGPGVGKSTLVASIARNTAADVNVIALIGERGREVRDFIESALGEEGLQRSVVVVATGDESPLLRVRAAMVACAVAEHFREIGADVMLMMDSITRFCQAQRQIGLTVGEQPATKGYTPSVFAMLPRLLERAGSLESGGSITGLYAVLVEGDDLTEPISDASRGILDGHIALSRKLASKGRYPAIDPLESISRVADEVCDENHIAARRELIKLMAAHAEAEELINIGAYAHGSNSDCDVAIALKESIDGFLQQAPYEKARYPETCRTLVELAQQSMQLRQQLQHRQQAAKQSASGPTAK